MIICPLLCIWVHQSTGFSRRGFLLSTGDRFVWFLIWIWTDRRRWLAPVDGEVENEGTVDGRVDGGSLKPPEPTSIDGGVDVGLTVHPFPCSTVDGLLQRRRSPFLFYDVWERFWSFVLLFGHKLNGFKSWLMKGLKRDIETKWIEVKWPIWFWLWSCKGDSKS